MCIRDSHNTLTRRLEPFAPSEPGHVRMYVCGITVYDQCHLGHARMVLAFDIVYRWLLASGWRVTYVRNITDIEDKIIKRALERGISIRALTDEMIAGMHRDFAALGAAVPTHEPREMCIRDRAGAARQDRPLDRSRARG